MYERSESIYPLRNATSYSIGQLRASEAALLSDRQADPELSARLRAQKRSEIDWAKTRNEELSPFVLLADFLAWDDGVSFKWTPNGAADFEVFGLGVNCSLQCTMAYEKLPGVQGGHLHHKETEHFNEHGFAFSGGRPDAPTASGVGEDLSRWRAGLADAIKSKLGKPSYVGKNLALLLYARGCFFKNIDTDFEEVVRPALEAVDWRSVFETVYVVDYKGFARFDKA